ncbi:DNA sulfur modification protein DndB [Bacillus massiliigorillae]|uniref:DNA sulfur modification protein DndB n=1 Tax=Bacillus massiliigorillae TaxID=1243664 RepID=UPI0003A584D2|nr:DNA sulfur modification protein DndB [Bacillus massiliigorillae]
MIINNIFSKQQRLIYLSINDIMTFSEEGKLVLRNTNQARVKRIKDYMLENAISQSIYFPPLVAAVCNQDIIREQPICLNIIDGSHRLKAIIQLRDYIQRAINNESTAMIKNGYKLLNIFTETSIAIQLIGELSTDEANQLYIDLNIKGKKVSLSKRISYDSRSLLNRITNNILANNQLLQIAGVEMEKRSMIRPANKKLLSLSQLRQLVNIFICKKLLYNKQEIDTELILEEEEYVQLVNSWFGELFALCPPETIGNDLCSIFSNFQMLLGIALYVNKNQWGQSFENRKQNIANKMKALNHIEWSRDNPRWQQFKGTRRGKQQLYYIDSKKGTLLEIVAWLEAEGR